MGRCLGWGRSPNPFTELQPSPPANSTEAPLPTRKSIRVGHTGLGLNEAPLLAVWLTSVNYLILLIFGFLLSSDNSIYIAEFVEEIKSGRDVIKMAKRVVPDFPPPHKNP